MLGRAYLHESKKTLVGETREGQADVGRARLQSCRITLYFCHSEAALAAEESAFLNFPLTPEGRNSQGGPMEFKLKTISPEGIEAALSKAELYRFLHEPAEAESICQDVLAV